MIIWCFIPVWIHQLGYQSLKTPPYLEDVPHTAAKLESLELSVSELDDEVVGESLVGSSYRRATSVRVVVVALLARGRLVLTGTLFRRVGKYSRAERSWTCSCVRPHV